MEEEKKEPDDWRGTVLGKVLSSLCSYHRKLLYCILQHMQEDYSISLALRDAHRRMSKTEPYCCPAAREYHSDSLPFSLCSCTAAGCAGCLTACGLRTCAVTSVCICMKTLACQNLALGCCSRVICPGSTVDCAHQKILLCQHQHSRENLCISHANNALGVQLTHPGVLNSRNACPTCRSPSPPPLSPMPVDMECKMSDQTYSCKGPELTGLCKPPLLLPQQPETEGEDTATHPDALQSGVLPTVKEKSSDTEEEKPGGSFLGDLMDEFTEKLKNIQPPDRGHTPRSANVGKSMQAWNDQHLTEIISTVLHSSSDKEYDLKELFEQCMAAEPRSPQTRSRRRQEVLAAMSKSPDLPAARRQSLQIKRDIARLEPSSCRRKLGLERSKCPRNTEPSNSFIEQSSFPESVSEKVQTELLKEPAVTRSGEQCSLTSKTQSFQEKEKQSPGLPEIPLCNELEPPETVAPRKTIGKSHLDKNLTFHPKSGRSRRQIVPPPRFSSYVTEPRKMYYAACFSESIFIKHSTSVKSTAQHDSAEINYTCSKGDTECPIKTEAHDYVMHPLSNKFNPDDLPKKIRICENEDGESSEPEGSPRTDCQSPTQGIKLMDSPSARIIQNSSSTDRPQQHSLNYVSPIKLMLVSPVKGENGVRYTLKSADLGSDGQGETFDPCIEASWAGTSMNEQTLGKDLQRDPVQNVEFQGTNIKQLEEVLSVDEPVLIDHSTGVDKASSVMSETTPVKRRPGRPKKLGPQIEKAVKRPIGRPRKAKPGDQNGASGRNVVNQIASGSEGENKNLKITITYGRSRKARRVVSEGMGHLSTNQHAHEVNSSSTSNETSRMNSSGDLVLNTGESMPEDLNFVMPAEDRKGFIHSSSNIKCQKQSDSAVTRKPGRPAKVKISGISVTVTTVSPRQRKIHMKRDIKESAPQRRALVMEFESSKQQKTINKDVGDVFKDGLGRMEESTEHSRTSFVSVRHSVRERKPSMHLLYSVATARSFGRGSGLVCRSHKLLMNKPASEIDHETPQQEHEEVADQVLSRKISHRKSVIRFSGVSMDSIFASKESLKWWSINASPETLNEELTRRIKLLSETWVSGVLEEKKSEEIKTKQNTESCKKVTGCAKQSSAVKMLFERNYSMEKLCSWFMQTTETQSLAIVKKASSRNPYEIFHYNPNRSTCRENICPSPQAERLRKHVKKFAKVVPKSPMTHQQEQATLCRPRRSFSNGYLFKTSCGTWVLYKTTLLRAKSKFKTRAKKILTTETECTNHRYCPRASAETAGLSKDLNTSANKVEDASDITEDEMLKVETFHEVAGMTDIPKEERISSKAWSPETLKECRVFLKKINSPNTKSAPENDNICSVKFNISPACCDLSLEQEAQKSSETTKLEKTWSSPKKSLSFGVIQNKSTKKRRSSRTSDSPPPKVTRQMRSCRGVLGARWCDFVLGN